MATALLEEEEPDERGKVFLWAKERGIWLHLNAFLLFSVLAHLSGFYLFKVVYPSPVRVEAESDSITILDPMNPAVRAAIRRLSDRTIYLSPPSEKTEVRVGMEAGRVNFAPAFQRIGMDLIGPPGESFAISRIDPMEEGIFFAGELKTESVRVKLSPSLASGALAPWSILHDYLATADAMPFLRIDISVSPDGGVSVEGVQAELEESDREELDSVIESTLRFLPSVETRTGWIEIGG